MYGFWIFPLLCLLFMAIMMVAGCGPRGHRNRSGNARETPRDILERRYAKGEIDKDQFEAVRRDLAGHSL
jgi:putative membrane protein